jgi:single stranded DNA-binding protein
MARSSEMHILIGFVGRDPSTGETANGHPYANFSLACTRSWKNKQSGEWEEETTWYDVGVFGNDYGPGLTGVVQDRVRKGSHVKVVCEGMKPRKYNGEGGERLSIELKRIISIDVLDKAEEDVFAGDADPEPEPAPSRRRNQY